MTWANFYKNRLNKEYFSYIQKHYKPFIEEIGKHLNSNSKVLEIGCGIGSITKALIRKYDGCFNISDKDIQMLELSKLNTGIQGFAHNILNNMESKYDIIHSHGVLEHFSEEEIVDNFSDTLITNREFNTNFYK